MRNPLRPKDPIEHAEHSLADSRRRLDELTRGLGNAQQDAKTANEARMALLVDEGEAIDSPAMRKATDAVRTAESNVSGVEGAIAVVRARVADHEAALAALRDRGDRAAIADRAEARAARIEALAAGADKAFEEAMAKMGELRACLARDGLFDDMAFAPGGGYGAIVDAVRRRVAPVPSAVDDFSHPPPPTGALAAALRLQVEPLRARAVQVRSGQAPAIEPGRQMVMQMVRFQDTTVVLRQGIRYQGVDARWVEIPPGGVSIPEPVAAAAVQLGIGFAPPSKMGALITAEMKRPAPAGGSKRIGAHRLAEDGQPIVDLGLVYHDVGVSLFDLAEAERARLAAERAAA